MLENLGIWRPVRLILRDGLRPAGRPAIDTAMGEGGLAEVNVSWPVVLEGEASEAEFVVGILSDGGGGEVASVSQRVVLSPGRSEIGASLSFEAPRLWSTWDRGKPFLYRAELYLRVSGRAALRGSAVFGVRTIELVRNDRETTFVLNGRRVFLRGTSYFPDVYLSALDRSRYVRDLQAMVRAGMNAVRVHVHVENDAFYDIADRMGLVVVQDFDLNWVYPTDDGFCRRAVSLFEAMIQRLHNHPSVICWICQNEPRGRAESPLHKVSPGPQLEEAALRMDPSRPSIRSSDVDDRHSGDSHNWTGSLQGHDSHYSDVHDTREKLNTEFGFDAPPAAERVQPVPEIAMRLATVLPRVAELHDYHPSTWSPGGHSSGRRRIAYHDSSIRLAR